LLNFFEKKKKLELEKLLKPHKKTDPLLNVYFLYNITNTEFTKQNSNFVTTVRQD